MEFPRDSKYKPFHSGEPRDSQSHFQYFKGIFFLLLSSFGFVFCLVSLYLAMRGVMRLGGMVAVGGPYQIAHPAPNFVWIFPVSIWAGLLFVFINFRNARQVGGLNLMVLAWPALFLSLGWNFLEFGVSPPGGQGLAWGWVICGVVFVLMGGIPLFFMLKYVGQGFRKARMGQTIEASTEGKRRISMVIVLLQLMAVGAGIWGADRYFRYLSEPKKQETGMVTTAKPAAQPQAVAPAEVPAEQDLLVESE